jgi:hypothetical protein
MVNSSGSTTISKSNENLLANAPFGLFPTNVTSMSQPVAPVFTSNHQEHTAPVNPFVINGSRRPKKAANSGYELGSEKVQNAPASNEGRSVDLNALYSVLEKFVNEEKRSEGKMTAKIKPSNLIQTEQDEIGAVGGEAVTSSTNDPHSDLPHQLPRHTLHISPSTGAIRKKPRNHEFLPDSANNGSNDDVPSLTETVRPLMAAEGRPSELRSGIGLATVPPVQSLQASSHLLLKRPPTTGANGKDDDEASSTDDDLAEADQTAIEMSTVESEPQAQLLNGNHASNGASNHVNTVDSSTMPEDQAAGVIGGQEEEEEDNLSAAEENDGVRLSGDGEQGL